MFYKQRWIFLFLFSSSALAANGHIYLGGTISASQAKISNPNPQINYYNGLLTDTYPVSGSRATATLGLNGGYEFVGIGYIPAIAIGVGIYGTPENYDYRGQLIETAFGDSGSTLYDYKFQVNSVRMMVETQFTWIVNKLTPFINIGIGSAWIHLNGYTESPVDNTGYVALPPFQSYTKTNLTYQLGLGVGYAFSFTNNSSDFPHERVTLGYRYVNLGDVFFKTRGLIYPYKLDMDSLITNEAYLTYTHLF